MTVSLVVGVAGAIDNNRRVAAPVPVRQPAGSGRPAAVAIRSRRAGYPPRLPDPAYPDPGTSRRRHPGQPYPPTQPYQPAQPLPARPAPGVRPQPTYPEYSTTVVPPRQRRHGRDHRAGGPAGTGRRWRDRRRVPDGPRTTSRRRRARQTPAPSDLARPRPDARPRRPRRPARPTAVTCARSWYPGPNGAKKCSPEEGTNGALTLNQAAKLSTDPVERTAELQPLRLHRRRVHCWVGGDKTVVDIRLYQFDSTDGARASSPPTCGPPRRLGGQVTDVSGVPGGRPSWTAAGQQTATFTIDQHRAARRRRARGRPPAVGAGRRPPSRTSTLSAQYHKL